MKSRASQVRRQTVDVDQAQSIALALRLATMTRRRQQCELIQLPVAQHELRVAVGESGARRIAIDAKFEAAHQIDNLYYYCYYYYYYYYYYLYYNYYYFALAETKKLEYMNRQKQRACVSSLKKVSVSPESQYVIFAPNKDQRRCVVAQEAFWTISYIRRRKEKTLRDVERKYVKTYLHSNVVNDSCRHSSVVRVITFRLNNATFYLQKHSNNKGIIKVSIVFLFAAISIYINFHTKNDTQSSLSSESGA